MLTVSTSFCQAWLHESRQAISSPESPWRAARCRIGFDSPEGGGLTGLPSVRLHAAQKCHTRRLTDTSATRTTCWAQSQKKDFFGLPYSSGPPLPRTGIRSEERRVGKEC